MRARREESSAARVKHSYPPWVDNASIHRLGSGEYALPFFQECGLAREKQKEKRAVQSSLNHQVPFQLTDGLLLGT